MSSAVREPMEPGVDASEAVRRDEEALARGALAVRATFFRRPGFSVGVSQPSDAPCVKRARASGLAVVRRASGGTGVLHEAGDLLWSLVLPRSDSRVGRDFARAYDRLGLGAVGWLEELGHPGARWVDAPRLSEEFCLLGSRGLVLALDGRILGGAAQHATTRALLHHGTVAYRVDRARLARIFDVPREELSRRLGSLLELGVRDPPKTLASLLAETTARAFDA